MSLQTRASSSPVTRSYRVAESLLDNGVESVACFVRHELGWLANGMSADEIIDDFPELEREDIQACLAYAADRERMAATISGD
jgi:hypothetical protein